MGRMKSPIKLHPVHPAILLFFFGVFPDKHDLCNGLNVVLNHYKVLVKSHRKSPQIPKRPSLWTVS